MTGIQINLKGLLIPMDLLKKSMSEIELKKILKTLSIKSKVVGRKTAQYNVSIVKHAYKIKKIDNVKYLILPKIALSKFDSVITSKDVTGNFNNNAIQYEEYPIRKFNFVEIETELYPYQKIAVDYLYNLSTQNQQSHQNVAYLQMDTGLGKSRVGCALIVKRQEPAIIVVPTQAIAEQWLDEFSEMYPTLNVTIYNSATDLAIIAHNEKYHINNKKEPKLVLNATNYDVFIVIINTFREKDSSFIKEFGTIILDEAHEYHSNCNSEALWLAQTNFVLGLSATPDERPDELDKYIQLHLGPIIYPKDIPNFDISSVNFKGHIRVVEYEGADKYCEAVLTPAGTVSAIMTVTNILNDPYRLALIVNEIKRLNTIHLTEEGITHGLNENKKHGIFVFVERRDFLITLRDALLKEIEQDDIIVPELDDCTYDTNNINEDTNDDTYDDTNNTNDDTNDYQPSSAAISILRGGISKNTMIETRKAKAHIVLTTYGYSRRGISLPDMTSLVLVSPRRNGMRQIIGRILRRNSDETIIRQIVDIVDVCTVLKGQFAERRKIYIEKFGKKNMSKVEFKWNEFN